MDIEIKDESGMISFGERLGEALVGGEVVELIGDIGAGKTTLVKGIALGLEIKEYIQSPSFTINRVYDGRNNLKMSHYDFYRLGDAGIMTDEISEVLNDDKTVTIIEWAGAVQDVLPSDRLIIKIDVNTDDYRRVNVVANGVKSSQVLRKIKR